VMLGCRVALQRGRGALTCARQRCRALRLSSRARVFTAPCALWLGAFSSHLSLISHASPTKSKSPAASTRGKETCKEDLSAPRSCAATLSSKDGDCSISDDVEALALALTLEKDEHEVAIVEAEGGGDDEKNKRENSKKNKMGLKEEVANLLQKAAAYTAFIRERMKDDADKDSGAAKEKPEKRDGQFEHQERDERQPKLVQGVMRKYQIEGLMWISSLYENGLNGILAGTCAICVPGQPQLRAPPFLPSPSLAPKFHTVSAR
jgi:hypothetical protein